MENPFEMIIEKLNNIETLLESLSQRQPLQEVGNSEILNLEETSKYTSMARATLYKMTSTREIPHFKRGKRLYFRKSELDAWITNNRVMTKEEIDGMADEYIMRKGRRS
jgi:excisionase family DNA binding protein